MDRKQLVDTMMVAIDNALANVHTATVARVTGVTGATISCRPVINRMVDGRSVELPEFVEVPPVFLQGGGSFTAYPIAPGDYCLLIFTERCFDNWWAGVDFAPPLEYRMHDYSDGFAIVGINPLAGAIPVPAVVRRVGDSSVEGNYDHTGDYVLTGNLTVNGNITVAGGDVTAGGISLKTHTHGGVEPGGGSTGQPQ